MAAAPVSASEGKSVHPLEAEDIPGLLYRGYGKHRFATLLFLAVRDGGTARAWLAELLGDAALHFGSTAPGDHVLQVAFGRSGLEKLGVERRFLESFATPFREGMTSPHRARILGDVGASAAEHWAWGRDDEPVDVVLALYSAGDEASMHRERLDAELDRAARGGLDAIIELPSAPLPGGAAHSDLREHFGFADGISQPVWRGSGREDALAEQERQLHLLPAGEFVLGQQNAYGVVTPVPRIQESGRAFGLGGSYLVVRQLAQDVSAFWHYFDEQAAASGAPERALQLAAKAVGRWPDGSPLTTCPHAPDPAQARRNDFLYGDLDRHGLRCPVGAHVRRGYPRDAKEEDRDRAIEHANTHRILRRGRSYGDPPPDPRRPDGEARGLLFLCLNANPERQFEFVQQSWLGSESFDGLQGERDPLTGTQPSGGGRFSIPGVPFRERLRGIPQFVHVKGGAYLFLPGRLGLEQLSRLGSG